MTEPVMVPLEAVGAGVRREMRALLDRYFEGVREEDFAADLAEKDRVVLLRDVAGELIGFSTAKVYRTDVAGAPRRVLFSGDTIVAPEAWRSPAAVRGWLRAVLALRREAPEPLDWFLLSSGQRTFRIMTTLFRVRYPDAGPRPGAEHAALRGRLEAYARARYGDAFDAGRGVVRLPRSVHRLRPGVGDVTAARLRDPAVALFAALNPGHLQGDELACLCELDGVNLTAVGRRFLGAW